MNTTSALVFDLDGTLADSSSCIVGAVHHQCRALGLPLVAAEDVLQMIGQPLGSMLKALLGVEGEALRRSVDDYSVEYRRLAMTQERLFEGAVPMLRALRGAGFRLAIATGKSQRGAESATARLGLAPLFDTIHGILPGTPGKPDPAVLQRAMDTLGAEARECIMVGDTTFDMDLAHALGVRTAAVLWGAHSQERLVGCGPSFVAAGLAELEAWLLSQRSTEG